MNILIIDDDPIFVATLARRLTHAGRYEVTTCDTTTAALITQQKIDAILLDMQLGDSSGLDAIEPLNQHFSPTHLIMLTGYASIATTVEAMKRGATDYLAKPVSLQEILRRLEGKLATGEQRLTPLSPLQLEREHIERMLRDHDGNISATATALGMHRRTLQRKLQKFSRGS